MNKNQSMSQSNRSLMHTKKQILQKDLSFSNEIFKRTLHSAKSSHESIHNHNNNHHTNHFFSNNNNNNSIPPLANYNQSPPPLIKHHLSSSHQKRTEQPAQEPQKINIFQRKFKPYFNTLNQSQIHQPNLINYSSIPPLSQLQETIAKKYPKQQQNQHHPQKNNQPVTVHFDNSQQHPNFPLNNNNIHQVLNIESLQQSRIANDSIQKHNNWIINNLQQNSGFFQDNTILSDLSKKSLNKKNVNKSLMNNSFKNMNPLQLVNNSLHNSHLPMFVEDDQLSEDNFQGLKRQNNNNNEANLTSIPQKLKIFNTINNNKQKYANNGQQQQQMRVNWKKLTIEMYQHYVRPFFGQNYNNNDLINEFQTSSIPDSILINDFDTENKGFDLLTTKSTPIRQQENYLQLQSNQKTVSQIKQNLFIQENYSYQQDSSQLINTQRRQHFINDKSPQQIISAILSDPNKMKLYLKYLQLKIVKQESENSSLCQNYELLSCLLLKINQITEKGQINTLAQKTLAQSIENLSRLKQQKPRDNYQAQISRPQIIRSSKGIKINFDPYLKYQSDQISSQISYLKKCLQEKSKEQELIKVNYDAIIHNYASSLENLAKNSQNNNNNQGFNDDRESDNGQSEQISNLRKSQQESQRLQQKMYLDVNASRNDSKSMSSSVEENKRYRKATFGKTPSFRGSGNQDAYY